MKLRRYSGCTRGRRKEAKQSPSPRHSAARAAGDFWGAARAPEHPASTPPRPGRRGRVRAPALAWQRPPTTGRELTHLQLHRSPDNRQHHHHFPMKLPPRASSRASKGKETSPLPSVGKILPESLSILHPCLCRSATQASERGCPHGGRVGKRGLM